MAKPLVEVAIGADGSVFVREVNRAAEASDRFSGSVRNSSESVAFFSKSTAESAKTAAKWVAGIAAAAATAATALVKSSIDSADATGILAGKLGVTTEALSRLQYAAKLSDVSQGALESSLRKLATTLVSATDPASKAAKALGAIGLSASELLNIPADQQIARIGDALSRVENTSTRAALAQQIFGKSGQALLPLLAEGEAGIRALGDEAERLGVVISTKTAESAMAFNDNLDRLGSAVEGLGLAVAEKILPQMDALVLKIIELAQQEDTAKGIAAFISGIGTALTTTAQIIATTGNVFQYLGEEIAAAVGGPAVGDFERINDAINTAKNGIAFLEGKQKALSGGLQVRQFSEEDQRRLQAYRDDYKKYTELLRLSENLERDRLRAQEAANAAATQASQAAEKDAATQPKRQSAIQGVTAALRGETDAEKAARAARDAATKAAANATKAVEDFLTKKAQENAMVNMSAREQARYRAQLELTEMALRGNITVTDEVRRQVDAYVTSTYDAEQATRAHEKAMQDAANAADPWAEALTGAVERIDSAFADLWKGAFDGFADFADNLKDAFKQLLAELANMAITRPILMRIGAAFGLGGSSGAMAAGNAGSMFSGIGSLFSGAKSFIGGFKSGGLSGGIDALTGAGSLSGNWLGSAMSDFRFALGDMSRSLGLDGLAGRFDAAGLKINTFGQSLVDLGANLGAGMAGNWAGNKLGQSLFGERKTTGAGGTIGGVIGSAWGPLGTMVGSFLGSLAENAIGKIFGLGDQAKWGKLGITTGSAIPTDGSALQTVTGASGLTLTAVAKRTDAEAAKQLLEGFNAIDGALTAAARSAGITVDFANKVLGNTSLNVDNQGPKNSFGVGARLDKFSAEAIKGSADDFARAWLAEIDDQISARIKSVLGDTSKKTADQIVTLFGYAADLDRLLKINVLEATAQAAEAAASTILDVYDKATQKVVDLAAEYDGTAESLANLNGALTEQKAIAIQLAEQYRQVADAVNAAFGDAITQIQDSLLSEADLYAKRRQQIAELTTELQTTIDPSRIAAISDQINTLALSAFQMLDDGQRAAMGAEFVAFLENARSIATAQIQAGTDSLASRETGVAASVDMELLAQAAKTQQDAANTFAGAVEQFAGLMNGQEFNLESILANFRAAGVEVNG